MLGYGSNELFRGIDLEVLSVFTFFHPSMVNHLLGFLNKFNLLDVEDVPYDILGDGFPALRIIPLDTNAVVNAKTGMAPCHQFPDQFVCNLSPPSSGI